MKQLSLLISMAFLAIVMLTGCKDDKDPNQEAYDKASLAKGGIMYDNFFSTQAGYDQNSPNINTLKSNSDFFRCKQCHGWDGLGRQGSYINRAPKTTRPNVSALNLYAYAQGKSFEEIYEGMKKTAGRRDIAYDLSTYDPSTNSTEGDKMPNYTQLMTNEQIWDLVKFMKEGMFDVTQLYDASYTGTYPTGSASYSNVGKNGMENNGSAYYASNCAGCHGSDGTAIQVEGMSVGKFTRSKANEVQHKVKYGQLGSSMVGAFDITLSNMKDLYKALSNTSTFPD